MSNAGKPANLKKVWEKAEVEVKLPTSVPRSVKISPSKRKRKESTEDGASAGREAKIATVAAASASPPSQKFDTEGKKQIVTFKSSAVKSPAAVSGMTVGAASPNPHEAEEAENMLRDRGVIPFLADLEACKRVGEQGLAMFKKMSNGLAEELPKKLQGKLATLNAENYYFAGRLARVQAELDSQRDFRYFDLSSVNRSLKEEAEKLKGIQERLNAANKKVAEQNKELEKLPTLEPERNNARESLEASRVEAEGMRGCIAEMTQLNEEAKIRFGKASIDGFQNAINLTSVLAPEVEWKYFSGQYEAPDGKIWKGDELAYDPAEQEKTEAEEEQSPTAEA